uniref:Uncharacterized protein n=1 Tax=Triticum urartu TaxID=4572 RepID=A0A8R7P5B3_TRIUA
MHRYSSGTPVPKSRPPIRRCLAHPHARGFASSCTRHLKHGRGTLLPSNLFGLCKGKRRDESNVWLGFVKGREEGNDMEQLQGHTRRGGSTPTPWKVRLDSGYLVLPITISHRMIVAIKSVNSKSLNNNTLNSLYVLM